MQFISLTNIPLLLGQKRCEVITLKRDSFQEILPSQEKQD